MNDYELSHQPSSISLDGFLGIFVNGSCWEVPLVQLKSSETPAAGREANLNQRLKKGGGS